MVTSAERMHEWAYREKARRLEQVKEMRVTGFIQPAETKHWKIDCSELKEEDLGLEVLRAMRDGHGRFVPPGVYTRLFRKENKFGDIMMSDTPDELYDHFWPFTRGTGRVLINGLGLGCLVKGLLSKPEVTRIDVVEIDQELIDLIGPYYHDPRVHIHCHDALTMEWPRGTKFDLAWHDIWTNLTSDNLPSMARLKRMYGRRSNGNQGAWGEGFLDRWGGRY